jgi:hypothetical protein
MLDEGRSKPEMAAELGGTRCSRRSAPGGCGAVKKCSASCSIAQGSIEESRYYLILANDLEYGDASGSSQLPEEVGKPLEAYSQTILNSEFCLLNSPDNQGAAGK